MKEAANKGDLKIQLVLLADLALGYFWVAPARRRDFDSCTKDVGLGSLTSLMLRVAALWCDEATDGVLAPTPFRMTVKPFVV
jgi:hypothetical protein